MRAWQNLCCSEADNRMMKVRNMDKKGQEEVVGFVLIVVLVAVIGVVFLGISLRTGGTPLEKQSKDVSQFLESAMEYTSDCAPYNEPDYLSLGELVKACYSKVSCLSGEEACTMLNKTASQMIENSWGIGPDKRFKGYVLNSTYSGDSVSEKIMIISRGNCSFNAIGGEYLSPAYPGNIRTNLKLCYTD